MPPLVQFSFLFSSLNMIFPKFGIPNSPSWLVILNPIPTPSNLASPRLAFPSYAGFWGLHFFAMICCVAIGKLLMMYLEWSAIWNMSIVISVLDGVYGIGAFRVSYFFSRGFILGHLAELH
ncbi:uncharacterized protein LOC130719416 [Lotus japonicus]|uniref:uncharacterized protein LOC130719416 n=1 Tax=Lotus japonicus TaxID=34305 RepID=UPI00258E236E|nr:uncharacterized protein LOC130719416 [Lotus japonicus]